MRYLKTVRCTNQQHNEGGHVSRNEDLRYAPLSSPDGPRTQEYKH
jgi:hypothetical protein